MYKYNNIIKLLGYTNAQVHSISDNYKEEWLDEDGIKMDIIIDGKHLIDNYHFISKERLEELLLKNRELSLSILDDDGEIDIDSIDIPKWKVGDMCYFDFKIHYISDMWDDRIRGCKDEYGGTGSYSLEDRCFKITPHTMKCSNLALFHYNWIGEKEHLVPHEYIINYPDIFSTLIGMWVDLINGESNNKINKFGNDIIEAINHENFDLIYFNDDEENEENDYRIFRERRSSLSEINITGD